jgi:hypothetical protein
MHVLFIFFSLSKITIINNNKHLYTSKCFYRTCMEHIFPRKYITQKRLTKLKSYFSELSMIYYIFIKKISISMIK